MWRRNVFSPFPVSDSVIAAKQGRLIGAFLYSLRPTSEEGKKRHEY